MYSNYVLGLSNSQKEMMRITEESTTGIVILDGAGLSTRLQNYSRQVLEKVKVKWFGSIENRYGKFWKNLLMIVTDRKSTRLNSSHQIISYAVFYLKKINIFTTLPHFACHLI